MQTPKKTLILITDYSRIIFGCVFKEIAEEKNYGPTKIHHIIFIFKTLQD